MKLFTSPGAPNPRRVALFMAEKAITEIELVPVDLNALEHKSASFLAKSRMARVPSL